MKTENQYHLLPHVWQGPGAPQLVNKYREAFAKAKELYVVSAFLTEWPDSLALNAECFVFRLIVGADFGTTRRAALEAALKWLPKRFKGNVFAFNQQGVSFHPKAVLWSEHDGRCYFLIGSSNLTKAAFGSNVEANVTLQLSEDEYVRARAWIEEIEERSVEVNSTWLQDYEEAPIRGGRSNGQHKKKARLSAGEKPVFDLDLELSDGAEMREFKRYLQARRNQRATFDAHSKKPLEQLFRTSASKRRWTETNNLSFYSELNRHWAASNTTRMGGLQWVIRGKHADHQQLAKSLVAILDAPAAQRDSVVLSEKDRLHGQGIPTRAAVLTEMLCHFFPKKYPILDRPVRRWRANVGFDRHVGGSEGERYLRLTRAMRAALREAGPQDLGLENLAELDTLIWFKTSDEDA